MISRLPPRRSQLLIFFGEFESPTFAKLTEFRHNDAMLDTVSVRILEKDNNRRGDLFGRLMNDLFLSLGYDNVRLNIARSGREIDIEAEHRLEQRRAVAECKALSEKVGGTQINTFRGSIEAERGEIRMRLSPRTLSR
jgi:hypothetical protein